MKSIRIVCVVAASLMLSMLSGCGSMRNYKAESDVLVSGAGKNNLDAALKTLEENNKGDDKDKDLLYFMEKGSLQHVKSDFQGSTRTWMLADERVRQWEEEAKLNPAKLMGQIGSFIVNDKTRRYDGYDYEKVMLTTFLAMNHALQNDWDKARIEIKKTHEREAIIAEFRSKEFEKQEEEAKSKNVKSTFKDLKGYPVETLDDPEVVSLKNGYQSAFSHYLAGFIYEALGEASLAAPGYRKAIELRPNVKMLEDGLKGVDSRSSRVKPGETDVLFVIESGTSPARQSLAIPLPFPWRGGLNYTQASFPVIKSDPSTYLPSEIAIGTHKVPVSSVTNVDAMSRRALRDDMPGIILRTTVRAVAKGVAQKELANQAGLLGAVIGVVAVAATEQADERTWRMLPAQIALSRTSLPPGKHTVVVPTKNGPQRFEVSVAGKSAIVPIRLMGDSAYLLQPMVPALADNIQLAAVQEKAVEVSPAPVVVSKTPVTVKKSATVAAGTRKTVKK